MSSVPPIPVSHRKPWEEANPLTSGLLAFLIPGAGHLYQGRIFKGIIYLVCIHGAFFTGMCLGEGMTVHHKVAPNSQGIRKISLSYVAQFGAGIWALPAIVQQYRVDGKANQTLIEQESKSRFTAAFKGQLVANGPGREGWEGPLVGTVTLEPATSKSSTRGKFTGKLAGKPVDLEIAGLLLMEPPLGASPGRALDFHVDRQSQEHPDLSLTATGTVPRSLWNWYEVPPETPQLQETIGRLGKYWELALVFTWIAGLLNVLAVWDCVKGPSLGFGDERPAAAPPDGKDQPPTGEKSESMSPAAPAVQEQ